MRITLVVPSLSSGGAERVAQLLAQGLSQRGHEVYLVTTAAHPDFYALDSRVKRIELDLAGRLTLSAGARVSRGRLVVKSTGAVLKLRRALLDTLPRVVISFTEEANVITLLALLGTRTPVVVTEHIDPRWHKVAVTYRLLRRILYPRAHQVVSVSHGVSTGFRWLSASRRLVIHNPVEMPPDGEGAVDALELGDGDYIAAMGRLTKQKGFDLLLRAFAKVRARHPGWRLVIIGDGDLRDSLRRLACTLEISESVIFTGLQKDPFSILRRTRLFVLSSRWEGFGNVIVEAMACRLPVVAFDCPSGPAEIISEGVDGLLVPPGDEDGLAAAICRLIENPRERLEMANQAVRRASEYELTKIVRQWEASVLNSIENA